jgi:hypoxanthine phosphoribosyltransferase
VLPGVLRVLIRGEAITARVGELGRQIQADYAHTIPILVGVLKGAVIFLADLMRAVDAPSECDFIAVSSYGASTRSSGIVEMTKDLSVPIEGRDVLIVEDIVDTGRTLTYLIRNFETRQPRTLRVCTLLDKASRREVPVTLDYVGFTIPDEFVVGYGLDFAGLYRNLPYIGVLNAEGGTP